MGFFPYFEISEVGMNYQLLRVIDESLLARDIVVAIAYVLMNLVLALLTVSATIKSHALLVSKATYLLPLDSDNLLYRNM